MTEAILARDVAPVPQLPGDAPFFGKEARRRLLQHLLVVVEQAHAPGSRRMCLATMLSWISLVPPSIELPFDRNQERALPPFLLRSLSHSSASLPPAAMMSALRRLLSSVPAYFIMLGLAGCASPAFHMAAKRSLIAAKARASTSNAAISARSSGSFGFVTAPSEPPPPSPMPLIISRSWPRRYLATSQPLFTSPTICSLGTFTSSKKVSQKGEEPLISRIGLVETPGVSMSNNRKLIPPCLDSVEVRTRQKIQSALSA